MGYFSKMSPYNQLLGGPRIRAFHEVFRSRLGAIRGRIGRILGVRERGSKVGLGGRNKVFSPRGTDVKPGELHASVCNAPVPDRGHDHFAGFMQHLINNPVLPDPDPVQRFRTGIAIKPGLGYPLAGLCEGLHRLLV